MEVIQQFDITSLKIHQIPMLWEDTLPALCLVTGIKLSGKINKNPIVTIPTVTFLLNPLDGYMVRNHQDGYPYLNFSSQLFRASILVGGVSVINGAYPV